MNPSRHHTALHLLPLLGAWACPHPCPEGSNTRNGKCVVTCNVPGDCNQSQSCVDGVCSLRVDAGAPASSGVPGAAPVLNAVSPPQALQYSGEVTLTLDAAACGQDCMLRWRGAEFLLTTTAAGALHAVLPAGTLDTAGTQEMALHNTQGSSAGVEFTVRPSPAKNEHYFPNANNTSGQASLHLYNPGWATAHLTMQWFLDSGATLPEYPLDLAAGGMVALDTSQVSTVTNAAFGIHVQSDAAVAAALTTVYSNYALGYLSSTLSSAPQLPLAAAVSGGTSFLQALNGSPNAVDAVVTIHRATGAPQTRALTVPAGSRITTTFSALAWAQVSSVDPLAWSASFLGAGQGLGYSASMTSVPQLEQWIPGAAATNQDATAVRVLNTQTGMAQVQVDCVGTNGLAAQDSAAIPPQGYQTFASAVMLGTFWVHVRSNVPVDTAALQTRTVGGVAVDGCLLMPQEPARDLVLLGGALAPDQVTVVTVSNPQDTAVQVRLTFVAQSQPSAGALEFELAPQEHVQVLSSDPALTVPMGDAVAVTVTASAPVLGSLTREWTALPAYLCLPAETP